MGGYGLVNLNASWFVTPSWSLSARLNNAADKRYELVQGYNTPDDIERLLGAPALR